MGFARDRRFQVQRGLADRQTGGRIAYLFEVLEVTVRVTGFTLGSGTKYRRYIIEAFDVSFGCEIQVTTVGLRFAGERVLQVLLGLGACSFHLEPPKAVTEQNLD